MSTALVRPSDANKIESVLIAGDIAKLTTEERVQYYRMVCESVGLNPLTRPFEYITLNGKLTLYARKDCTDQLRNVNNVSVKIVAREVVDDCYVVTSEASLPNGRTDSSIGAVSIGGLKGEAKCNAMMKSETKAKRRVTLSICGLGMLDELEIETIPARSAKPVTVTTEDIELTSTKSAAKESLACECCHGSGREKYGNGTRTCYVCKGTGGAPYQESAAANSGQGRVPEVSGEAKAQALPQAADTETRFPVKARVETDSPTPSQASVAETPGRVSLSTAGPNQRVVAPLPVVDKVPTVAHAQTGASEMPGSRQPQEAAVGITYIDAGRCANLHRAFRDAVRKDYDKDKDIPYYQYLADNGYVDEKKQPTSAVIPLADFELVKAAMIRKAKSL
jgi:hypothetical protein